MKKFFFAAGFLFVGILMGIWVQSLMRKQAPETKTPPVVSETVSSTSSEHSSVKTTKEESPRSFVSEQHSDDESPPQMAIPASPPQPQTASQPPSSPVSGPHLSIPAPSSAVPSSAEAQIGPHTWNKELVIADFNAGPPNNLNGNFGAFTPNPEERVFICKGSIDPSTKVEGAASLRLEYNVGNGGAYNGFWMKFGPADDSTFDASGYQNLVFWIRGDAMVGIPSKIKIELKSGHAVARYYLGEITPEWKEIRIPLGSFGGNGVNLQALSEFTIVFEQRYASPGTQGAINVDALGFE